jgi:hypothetical protein
MALSDFPFPEERSILEERNIRCARVRPRVVQIPNLGEFYYPEDCPTISFIKFLFGDLPNISSKMKDPNVRNELQYLYILYEIEASRIFYSWSDEALEGFSRLPISYSCKQDILSYLKDLRRLHRPDPQ